MQKMKVIFYLKKSKTNAEGLPAIYGKIIVGETAATFSTGKYIEAKRWEETNHLRNIIKKDDAIKSYLKAVEDKADTIFLDFTKKDDDEVSAELVKSLMFGSTPISKGSQKTVLQAIDYHNDYFEKLVNTEAKADGTLDRYKCIRNITAEYIKTEYGSSDLPLYKMDKHFVYRLDTYLRTVKTYKTNVGCANNTTVKYIRNLKTIFNWIVKQGSWIEYNPFLVYDEKLKPVDTVYLEEEELAAIEKKEFDCERLNTVKNIFLFSCYTSYAPVDAMKLTWDNVSLQKDKEFWIKAKRTKTKIDANVLLLPPAEKIINHYKEDPRCANDKRLLPRLSNQKMNSYLKEIADVCGIKKRITWYVARHTFATTVTVNHDIPLEAIAYMMGHTNTRQTQHYAKIREEMVSRHMKKLKRKYKK
jgi:site-specific recombinase XerD